VAPAGDAWAQAAPAHCALYRATDVSGDAPRSGASPIYRAELPGRAGSDDARTAEIVDVTPGTYRARCFLDTTGGGPTPKGDAPIAISGPLVVEQGATARASLPLAPAAD
jgi:hypothetical protein